MAPGEAPTATEEQASPIARDLARMLGGPARVVLALLGSVPRLSVLLEPLLDRVLDRAARRCLGEVLRRGVRRRRRRAGKQPLAYDALLRGRAAIPGPRRRRTGSGP